MPPPSAVTDDPIDQAQWQADPLADDTIAALLGPWPALPAQAGPGALPEALAGHWERVALLNRLIAQWTDNAALERWRGDEPGVPPEVAAALRAYLDRAMRLPDWADPQQIRRAEQIFFDEGVLSITLLFCASLPECYVVPDLAEVLHVTGQLEQRTDYRIRSTAAMIFPVMMRGGLTEPGGGGVAQVLKVRLIHAMVRHLILRGSPAQALAAPGGPARLERWQAQGAAPTMHQALFAHGWDVAARGLPSNQEEQAYTLLTFGYVYLRGLRRLGVALGADDERAVQHTWNVVGHLVGIRRELMATSLAEAEALFALMQRRGRAEPRSPDPRPPLAAALFDTMARAIPWRIAKPIPALLARRLIGPQASADLGLDGRVSLASRLLFALGMGLIGLADTLGRWVSPGFSLSRLVTRVLGYHLMTRLLMDQTRPLKLPPQLLGQAHTMMRDWGTDRRAPGWVNAVEDRFTVAGAWDAPGRP